MTDAEIRRRGLARYLLFQVPGWMVAAAVAYGAQTWFGLESWMAFGAWLLWLAKDAVLYPFVRRAYEPHPHPEPGAALVGRSGVATERLAPGGYVRIGSELWRAEAWPRGSEIDAGAPVEVHSIQGFTLRVQSQRSADPDRDR